MWGGDDDDDGGKRKEKKVLPLALYPHSSKDNNPRKQILLSTLCAWIQRNRLCPATPHYRSTNMLFRGIRRYLCSYQVQNGLPYGEYTHAA